MFDKNNIPHQRIDCKRKKNICLLPSYNFATIHMRHSQNRIFAANFAHNKVLPSYIHTGRTSYEHEISLHEYMSEL